MDFSCDRQRGDPVHPFAIVLQFFQNSFTNFVILGGFMAGEYYCF